VDGFEILPGDMLFERVARLHAARREGLGLEDLGFEVDNANILFCKNATGD
jgi:hypothetical protein